MLREMALNEIYKPFMVRLSFDMAKIVVWMPFLFRPTAVLISCVAVSAATLGIGANVIDVGKGEVIANCSVLLGKFLGVDIACLIVPSNDRQGMFCGDIDYEAHG